MDLDWNALKAVHDYFKGAAFKVCATGQEVAPQLFAVCVSSNGRVQRMAIIPTDFVGMFMSSNSAKDMFSAFIRELVTDGTPLREALADQLGAEPDLLVQVNEAWVTSHKDVPGANPVVERTEALLVALHTSNRSILAWHPIVTTPTRHAIDGTFPSPDQVLRMSGRFAMQDGVSARHATRH